MRETTGRCHGVRRLRNWAGRRGEREMLSKSVSEILTECDGVRERYCRGMR